ncbi:MAG TPA: hypothetical protein VGK34_08480, partial [Armatimonadota bacterium]
ELQQLEQWTEERSPIVGSASSGTRNVDDSELHKLRAEIQGKMTLLATEYAEGFIEQAQYRTLVRQYQEQIRELDRQAAVSAPKQITARDIRAFHQRFKTDWDKLTEEERRELIAAVCVRIGVYPDKIVLHTSLSIGDVTVPTNFFELVGTDDTAPLPGRFAPDLNPGQNAPGRN